MIIIIDESGETSINSVRKYFILGLVKVRNNKAAEDIANKINNFAKKIGHRVEFKFSNTKDKNKIEFFRAVIDCNFSFRCLVIDKEKLIDPLLKTQPKKAYNFFLKLLLEKAAIEENSLIQIDGNAPTKMKQEINSYLKNANIKYKKLEFFDSRKNRLIQLADMFVSSVGAKYNRQNDCHYKMIKRKIEDEWIFTR